MKRSLLSKYPKLLTLVVIIILSYIIFSNPSVSSKFASLGELNYVGALVSGMLIAFGFTAPIGIGLFIVLNPNNLVLAALLGGVGAMIADLIIYRFVRFSFMEEFTRLEHTKTFKKVQGEINRKLHKRLRNYLFYILADLILISPLPDEIAVTMLAGVTAIKERTLMALSFTLHTIATFLILYASS